MSRISSLFNSSSEPILTIYFTAGHPTRESIMPVMELLQEEGVHMIEIGMPYSDPLADGPVIQESNMKALQQGMSIPALFNDLDGFRRSISLPVLLMGYLNPVLQFGFEKFCRMASETGVDGLILPDLTPELFKKEYGEIIRRYHLDFVFLVTPETSEKRIRELDELGSGFIYAVTSSSITGGTQDNQQVTAYLERLSSLGLKNPVMAGFGIRDRKGLEAVSKHARGAIIGSAFIRALETGKNPMSSARQFLGSLKNSDDQSPV